MPGPVGQQKPKKWLLILPHICCKDPVRRQEQADMFPSCRLTVLLSSLLMFEGLSSWMAKHCCSMSKLHSHWPGRFPRAHWDCSTHLQWRHKTCYIMQHVQLNVRFSIYVPAMTLLKKVRKRVKTERGAETQTCWQEGGGGQVVRQSCEEAQMWWRGRFHSSGSSTIPPDQTHIFFLYFWKDDLAKTGCQQLPCQHLRISTRYFIFSRSLWTTPVWCLSRLK